MMGGGQEKGKALVEVPVFFLYPILNILIHIENTCLISLEMPKVFQGLFWRIVEVFLGSVNPLVMIPYLANLLIHSFLSLQIDSESNKKTVANLEKITADYKEMKKENSALVAQIKGK